MSQADEYLSARGITSVAAEAAGLFEVPDASVIYPDFKKRPALVIPYTGADGKQIAFTRDGEELPFARIRYLGDLPTFRGKKPQRFAQPSDSGCRAYFPPGPDWAHILADVSEPIMITEGEIKALKCTIDVAPCIALGGVSNTNRDGVFLPELENAEWEGREVYVCFDSDAMDNPNVLMAEARLVDELQTKRGAKCRLLRIPPTDTGGKQGLDDFLVAGGAKALLELVEGAQDLYALDAKVIALNSHIAWIERENMIYDLGSRMFIPKDSLTSGGKYSSLIHFAPAAKAGSPPKKIQVAKVWLTHAHAQRFSEVLFRPGDGPTVDGEQGRTALNLFTGWDERPGDVQPFLDLTEFLFGRMRPQDRDLPLKLMAYKAQNPQEKIPLCLVMIGPQGCGKTMWGEIVKEAFGTYGVVTTSASFNGEFQGWLESSLIALVNEAEHKDMITGADVLKGLISDLERPMNEKFRPARQIKTYTMYMITSNDRKVGSFAADDRRMIVVDCPPKREDAFYFEYLKPWKRAGGPKAVMHYLLNLDLQGWTPPAQAPMTAEKYMAYTENLTSVQRLAEDMKTADENTIKQWLDASLEWAVANELSNHPTVSGQARAIKDSVSLWQIRPWYMPEELAKMFPMLMEQQLGTKHAKTTPAGAISRELRNAGIPYLTCKDDPRGFRWKGKVQQFLIIADFDEWRDPISQEDFERYMKGWPKFGQLRGRAA